MGGGGGGDRRGVLGFPEVVLIVYFLPSLGGWRDYFG